MTAQNTSKSKSDAKDANVARSAHPAAATARGPVRKGDHVKRVGMISPTAVTITTSRFLETRTDKHVEWSPGRRAEPSTR